ncbi:MAG: CaiB/BaiF CoA transferase family protein [Candidatus Dormibacteria bacterium]
MSLTGVRVLDLSRLLPGPFASMVLTGLGADVIKVEDMESGDYMRGMGDASAPGAAMFTSLNRGKRSLRLDLRDVRGRDLFLDLCATADVVLESFRPGVMERLGLGLTSLHARNPALVLCRISGFGQDGPDRLRAGHDLNYLARAGISAITGSGSGEPAIPGVQIADLGGGGLGAVVAILAALRLRDQTGRGTECDVSMLDGLLSWMTPHLAARAVDGVPAGRASMLLNGGVPCYRVYACADGEVTVAALEPKFWSALCARLGLHHLEGDAFATGARRGSVVAEMEAAFSTRTRHQLRDLLAGADVCVEPVLDLDEVLADEQARHRALRTDPLSWFPFRIAGAPSPPQGAAPAHGEHSREVLAEIGVDDARWRQLVAAGVTA